MSFAVLAEAIKDATGATKAQSHQAVAELIEAIVYELKHGGSFTLVGFGRFTVRKTKARKGRNPATGEAIRIKAGKSVRFKVSSALKKRV